MTPDIVSGLDSEQKKAATAPAGRIRVRAGAGTGKTRTLAGRIAWLITEGVPAHEIVAVTFTNKAAREIAERVGAAVGPAARRVRIGTFHALSFRILRDNPVEAGLRDRSFLIVDDDEARLIFAEAVEISGALPAFEEPVRRDGEDETAWEVRYKAARRDWSEARQRQIVNLWTRVRRWKETGLDPAEAARADRERRTDEEEAAAKAYVSYQDELDRRNLCDLPDLVLRVVLMFDRNPALAARESLRTKHLLVDEYQDVNPVQTRWVAHLSGQHGNLMVVGDPDQCIYSFRCARSDAMENVPGGVSMDVSLITNRRCTEEILLPARLAVAANPRPEPKVLSSGVHGDIPTFSSYPDDGAEARSIAATVKSLIESGAKPGQIACLFRSGWAMRSLEDALFRVGVPYVLSGGTPISEREEVRDILAYLKLAVDPWNDLAFRRIVNRPLRGLGPVAAEAILTRAAGRGSPIHEACMAVAADPDLGLRQDSATELASLGRLLEMLAEDFRLGRTSHHLASLVIDETQYEAWLRRSRERFMDRWRNIETLLGLSREEDDLIAFLRNAVLTSDTDEDRDDAVRLSTIHASKGLEFDWVFCPAFEEGVMPSPRAVKEGGAPSSDDPWLGPGAGGIEEERRLAHVAFTRARKGLFVSCAGRRMSDWGAKRTGPSSFAAECGFIAPVPAGEERPKRVAPTRKGFARRRR